VFGLVFGLILHKMPAKWIVNKNLAGSDATRDEILERKPKPFTVKSYAKGVWDSLVYFGFYIVIGILLGAAVEVLVPSDWIAAVFKPGQWFSVLVASLMGIPLYACGGGAIPLLQAFISQGMSKGAALGFMIVGPATRITPLMSLGSIMKPFVIVLYVVFLVLFALCLGVLYG
jgi:uncharacterized membrane protein YraQ (UPF0718 family)